MIKQITKSVSALLKKQPGGRDSHGYPDRRRASRTSVRLPLKVLVPGVKGAHDDKSMQPLNVYTKELSSIGLSFVFSEAQIKEFNLMKNRCELRLELALPTRSVEILAVVASVSRLSASEAQEWYTVGVRIVKMDDDARTSLIDYLSKRSSDDDLVFEDLAFLE